MTEPIRVLHVLGNTNLGGAESRIMDLYRHIDRGRVQFDFLVHTDEEGYFDREIREMGGRIYHVPRFRLYNYLFYKKAMQNFFAEHHEFKVVQGHITSSAAIYLPIARAAGVPVTAAHARSAGVDRGIKNILTRLMRRNLSKKTDYMFTCSKLAGISVFGQKAVDQGKTIFVPNAINTSDFAYDEKKRTEMRKELGLKDQYVIGHVGRFHYAKNHEYLLRIFAELCRQAQNVSYVLILLGEGGTMETMKVLSKELGIADKVFFLGNHRNVYDYYQAMDYFVYPSRYEGLPGTMIEAQTSGLKCLMSDTICDEVKVTDLVDTMDIKDEPAKWADHIRETAAYERRSYVEEMRKAGFDVDGQAGIMMNFYENGKW